MGAPRKWFMLPDANFSAISSMSAILLLTTLAQAKLPCLFLEEGAGRRGSLLVRHNRVSGRFTSKNRLYPLKTAESDFRRRANQNKGASLTPRIKNHNREESRKRLLEPRSQKGLTVVYVYFSSGEFPFKV